MMYRIFFFFNDTATTEIYTLSLHDALPISCAASDDRGRRDRAPARQARARAGRKPVPAALAGHPRRGPLLRRPVPVDRKSTRLNSSHLVISYAVFCLKKKKHTNQQPVSSAR